MLCSCTARKEPVANKNNRNTSPVFNLGNFFHIQKEERAKASPSPSPVVEAQEIPLKSGQTSVLPWDKEEAFLNAKMTNGTPILMAAYHTVLHDPLPGEEFNVHLAASMLAGKVISPSAVFSQNQTAGPYTEERGFQKGPTYAGAKLITTIGGGVCKIASTLYNVAILSNLEIVERYNHGMPVPYVPYGQDATVSYGAKDIKFRNSTNAPIMIWAKGVDNVLYIAFYGTQTPPKVEWHHERISTIPAPKSYKNNTTIPVGIEKVLYEGMDGGIVRSWVTINQPDGSVTEKQLGNSRYAPFPFIIEKSLN
ncbi:MAG: VanW family protein [Hyphomonadaceae bacterium]|nr:VanW family protein [Clostridia bacterium]